MSAPGWVILRIYYLRSLRSVSCTLISLLAVESIEDETLEASLRMAELGTINRGLLMIF